MRLLNTEIQKLSSLKMCVEKIQGQDKVHLNSLKAGSNSLAHYSKLRAAFFTSKLWPNNYVIYYTFVDNNPTIPRTSIDEMKKSSNGRPIDPLQNVVKDMSIIEAIKKIVNERINPFVNLSYVYTSEETNAHIRIGFDMNSGSWSCLGTDCLTVPIGEATMNYGWFDVATVIHEFGHSLGLIHEHQNMRGKLIDWNKPKVYAWAAATQGWDEATTDENILNKYSIDQTNGSEFDPESIMLYFFPASLTNNNVGTHENMRLSKYDAMYISSVYPSETKNIQRYYKEIYAEVIDRTLPPFIHNMKLALERSYKSDNIDINIVYIAGIIGIVIVFLTFILVKYLLPRNSKKI